MHWHSWSIVHKFCIATALIICKIMCQLHMWITKGNFVLASLRKNCLFLTLLYFSYDCLTWSPIAICSLSFGIRDHYQHHLVTECLPCKETLLFFSKPERLRKNKTKQRALGGYYDNIQQDKQFADTSFCFLCGKEVPCATRTVRNSSICKKCRPNMSKPQPETPGFSKWFIQNFTPQ